MCVVLIFTCTVIVSTCVRAEIAKDQHQTPVWEQSYIFNLEGKEELLHCNVWNEATLGDDQSENMARLQRGWKERKRVSRRLQQQLFSLAALCCACCLCPRSIGRLDLSLDALDMSGKPRWYQLKDKTNFTKQTGEVSMSIVFEGSGLPAGSLAATTHQARVAPAASAPAASPVSPAPIVQAAPVKSPVATVAPPVVQAQAPIVQVGTRNEHSSAQPGRSGSGSGSAEQSSIDKLLLMLTCARARSVC